MRNIILITFLLLSPGICLAQEKGTWEDKLIASSFKTLAKAFVATADIKKLKEADIEKLIKMDEEKFNKRYSEAYEIIKDLPPQLKADYGVAETMTKEQAIKNMQVLDRKKMYELIDAVPDKAIARQFKHYVGEREGEFEDSDFSRQIQKFWNKIKAKAGLSGS